MINPGLPISPNAAAAAEETLAAYRSQQAEAAAHAQLVEREAKRANRERAAELRAHYEAALSSAMNDVSAGDERSADCIVSLVNEARSDAATVDVYHRPSKTWVAGRVALNAFDASVVVNVSRAAAAAFGVEHLSFFDGRPVVYRDRSAVHPVAARFATAFETSTAEGWLVALGKASSYLAFFELAGGRQGHVRSTTADGFDLLPRYQQWLADECEQIYSSTVGSARRGMRSAIVPQTSLV